MHARLKRYVPLLLVLLVLVPFTGRAAFLADLDQNGEVDLADVVLGLQVMAGLSPEVPQFAEGVDVDRDGRYGLAEVQHALHAVQNSGVALPHQATLSGPLSGAAVSAVNPVTGVRLSGIDKANSSATDLQVAGTFDLDLPGVARAEGTMRGLLAV